MDKTQPGWEMAAITGKIPLYYFTGTMQDGLLLIPQDGDAVFWVRQSYERAVDESLFPDLRKMRSYRDVAAGMGKIPSDGVSRDRPDADRPAPADAEAPAVHGREISGCGRYPRSGRGRARMNSR